MRQRETGGEYETRVAERRADRIAKTHVEPRQRQQAGVEPAAKSLRQSQHDGEDENRAKRARRRNRHVADLEGEEGGAEIAEEIAGFETERRERDDEGDSKGGERREAREHHAHGRELFAPQPEPGHEATAQQAVGREGGFDAAARYRDEKIEKRANRRHPADLQNDEIRKSDVARGAGANDHQQRDDAEKARHGDPVPPLRRGERGVFRDRGACGQREDDAREQRGDDHDADAASHDHDRKARLRRLLELLQ